MYNSTSTTVRNQTTLEEPENHIETLGQVEPKVAVRNSSVMGSEEDPKEYDRLRLIFKRVLTFGTLVGILVCFLLFVWAYKYGGGFSWDTAGGAVNIHIVIMIIFMVYLHGHASLMYRIFPNGEKYGVKLAHAALHLVVVIGLSVGLAAAVQSHYNSGNPHFYTLHSWIGISAIGLYYAQFLGGFVTFLLPMSPMSLRVKVLPFHRFTGQSLFTLSLGATITGIMLKAISSLGGLYPTLPAAGMLLNFSGFLALIFLLVIGNLLGDFRFRRRARPEGEMLLKQALGGGDGDTSDQTD